MNYAVRFPKDTLPGLVSNIASNAASNAINKLEIRISSKLAVRAGKGCTLFISNEDMDDFIRIINSLEDSGVIIDGVTETVKHQINYTRRWISWCCVSTFGCFIGTTVISSVVKGISGIGVMRAGRGYNNIDHMDKNF